MSWLLARPTFGLLTSRVVPRNDVLPDCDQVVPTPQQTAVQYANENAGIPSASFSHPPAGVRVDHRLSCFTRVTFFKVYMDQTIFSPVAVAYFFGSMSLLEGKGFGEAGNRISHVC